MLVRVAYHTSLISHFGQNANTPDKRHDRCKARPRRHILGPFPLVWLVALRERAAAENTRSNPTRCARHLRFISASRRICKTLWYRYFVNKWSTEFENLRCGAPSRIKENLRSLAYRDPWWRVPLSHSRIRLTLPVGRRVYVRAATVDAGFSSSLVLSPSASIGLGCDIGPPVNLTVNLKWMIPKNLFSTSSTVKCYMHLDNVSIARFLTVPRRCAGIFLNI